MNECIYLHLAKFKLNAHPSPFFHITISMGFAICVSFDWQSKLINGEKKINHVNYLQHPFKSQFVRFLMPDLQHLRDEHNLWRAPLEKSVSVIRC